MAASIGTTVEILTIQVCVHKSVGLTLTDVEDELVGGDASSDGAGSTFTPTP